MSKQIMQVAFAVLISLGIIAAASPNVQSKLESVFRKTGANTSATTSMFTDKQNLKQGTTNGQFSSPSQFDENAPSGSSHDCDSDSSMDD